MVEPVCHHETVDRVWGDSVLLVDDKHSGQAIQSLVSIVGMVPVGARGISYEPVCEILVGGNGALIHLCSSVHPRVVSLVHSVPMDGHTISLEFVPYFDNDL